MHLMTSCGLFLSVATAVVSAAPIVLPLHTMEHTTYLWITGLLALVGIGVNSYKAYLESQTDHDHV